MYRCMNRMTGLTLCLGLFGCQPSEPENPIQKFIDACHDKVASAAEYVPEFVDTNVERDFIDHNGSAVIKGNVKLQNGYGAWGMYQFRCWVNSSDDLGIFVADRDFRLGKAN